MSAPLGNPNIVTTWDPNVLRGWNVRPDDGEVLVGLQHQLHERLMMDVQWTRHWFGNFFATQYRATPPGDYDSFCITTPTDSRLPDGGGKQICGFMDLKQTAFGRTPDNFVTAAKNFGDVTDVYNGIDISFTGRLPNGGVASGGVSSGRERTDFCDVIGQAGMTANTDSTAGRVGETNISSYPSPLYCAVTPPYQPDWKGLISYPLPWGLNASATWQNRAGAQRTATYVVTAAQTTLGRAFSGGAATQTLQIIEPGTAYDERLNQVDARIAKTFRVGASADSGNVQPVQPVQRQHAADAEQPLQHDDTLAAADAYSAVEAVQDRGADGLLDAIATRTRRGASKEGRGSKGRRGAEARQC